MFISKERSRDYLKNRLCCWAFWWYFLAISFIKLERKQTRLQTISPKTLWAENKDKVTFEVHCQRNTQPWLKWPLLFPKSQLEIRFYFSFHLFYRATLQCRGINFIFFYFEGEINERTKLKWGRKGKLKSFHVSALLSSSSFRTQIWRGGCRC